MKRSGNVAVITAFLSGCIMLFASCKKSNDVGPSAPPAVTFKNQIAYFYKLDSSDGQAYKTLLQANNCGVTLIDMSKINTTDFTKYDLLVIGNNTSDDAYDFQKVTAPIKAAGKPVLMIGEGGGHFGEMINTSVNWGTTAGYSFSLAMIVTDSTMAVYKAPKRIDVPADKQLIIFSQAPYGQGFVGSPLAKYPDVEVIGQATTSNPKAYSVTFESGKYGFFGYYNSVNAMTQTGKDFVVNLAYYVGKLKL